MISVISFDDLNDELKERKIKQTQIKQIQQITENKCENFIQTPEKFITLIANGSLNKQLKDEKKSTLICQAVKNIIQIAPENKERILATLSISTLINPKEKFTQTLMFELSDEKGSGFLKSFADGKFNDFLNNSSKSKEIIDKVVSKLKMYPEKIRNKIISKILSNDNLHPRLKAAFILKSPEQCCRHGNDFIKQVSRGHIEFNSEIAKLFSQQLANRYTNSNGDLDTKKLSKLLDKIISDKKTMPQAKSFINKFYNPDSIFHCAKFEVLKNNNELDKVCDDFFNPKIKIFSKVKSKWKNT